MVPESEALLRMGEGKSQEHGTKWMTPQWAAKFGNNSDTSILWWTGEQDEETVVPPTMAHCSVIKRKSYRYTQPENLNTVCSVRAI